VETNNCIVDLETILETYWPSLKDRLGCRNRKASGSSIRIMAGFSAIIATTMPIKDFIPSLNVLIRSAFE